MGACWGTDGTVLFGRGVQRAGDPNHGADGAGLDLDGYDEATGSTEIQMGRVRNSISPIAGKAGAVEMCGSR